MLLVQDSFTLIIQCLQHVIIAANLVECQKMMNVRHGGIFERFIYCVLKVMRHPALNVIFKYACA